MHTRHKKTFVEISSEDIYINLHQILNMPLYFLQVIYAGIYTCQNACIAKWMKPSKGLDVTGEIFPASRCQV